MDPELFYLFVLNLNAAYKGQNPKSPVDKKTTANIPKAIASQPDITFVKINTAKRTANKILITLSTEPIFFFIIIYLYILIRVRLGMVKKDSWVK